MNTQDFVEHIKKQLTNEELGDAEARNRAVCNYLSGVFDGLELTRNTQDLVNKLLSN